MPTPARHPIKRGSASFPKARTNRSASTGEAFGKRSASFVASVGKGRSENGERKEGALRAGGFFFPNGPGLAKRFIWSPIESSRVERMAGPKVLAGRWRSASRWSLRLKRFVPKARTNPSASTGEALLFPVGSAAPVAVVGLKASPAGEALRSNWAGEEASDSGGASEALWGYLCGMGRGGEALRLD